MKTEALRRVCRRFQICFLRRSSASPIKLKPEWTAKRGERSLGRIGFGRFERDVVNLAGSRSAPFAGTVTLTNDCTVIRRNCYTHLGDVNGREYATVFPSKDTTRLDRFATPPVKSEDAVCFRNRKPSLDVRKFAPVRLAFTNLPTIELSPEGLHLFC
jgi:hypothetical protein